MTSQDIDKAQKRAAVLGSSVYNEAEFIFQLLEHKERKCVSALDTVTLLRGMGMNPVQAEVDALQEAMAPLVAELDELRLEEERKKEALRKKEEAKRGGDKDKAAKEKAAKEAAEKAKKEKEGKEGEGEEKEGEPKKKIASDPPEEIKNIDWHIFISSVEPMYKDNREERAEIVNALRCFDPENTGKIKMKQLVEVVTQNGESVLSPAEVKQLLEAFPFDTIEFEEFAHRIQGTYQPPPPPTAEEIAAQQEAERLAAEEAKKAAQASDLDSLLGGPAVPAAASADPPAEGAA